MNCQDVLDVVCKYYDTNPFNIFSMTKKRDVVYQRFFYMLFCRKYTKKSTFKIGDVALEFGRSNPLDHATVLHGVKTMYDLIRYDKALKYDYNQMDEIISTRYISEHYSCLIPGNINLLSMCR